MEKLNRELEKLAYEISVQSQVPPSRNNSVATCLSGVSTGSVYLIVPLRVFLPSTYPPILLTNEGERGKWKILPCVFLGISTTGWLESEWTAGKWSINLVIIPVFVSVWLLVFLVSLQRIPHPVYY